jgi:site-specific recombinase XerD
LNEAAGVAAGRAFRTIEPVALVAEKGVLCDHTYARIREELVRRSFAETTIRSYLHAVEAFRQYMGKRLDHLGPADIRRYQVHLLEDKKLANGTVVIHVSALRFLYIKVLKRRDMKEDLPYPKRHRSLPLVLDGTSPTSMP